MIKDVFICHTSEDKKEVVAPLVSALLSEGISAWYDENEIKWGDSLTKVVNDGLVISRFVMVVLSPSFLNKEGPKRELHAALNIEASFGEIKVLPLIVGTDTERKNILSQFPLLNDKLYKVWTGDPSEVVDALKSRLPKRNEININSSDENQFISSQGLGRCLCLFLSSVKNIKTLTENPEENMPYKFNQEEAWIKCTDVIDVSRANFLEFLKIRRVSEGDTINKNYLNELVLGPVTIKQRDGAVHFASILGINPLYSRRILELYELKEWNVDEVLAEYLALRDDLGSEIGRKYSDSTLAALFLFYMDVGITMFIKGLQSCSDLATDLERSEILRNRIKLIINSASYMNDPAKYPEYSMCLNNWKNLFADPSHLSEDFDSYFHDLSEKFKFDV